MKLQNIQSAILSLFPTCRCICGNPELEIGAVLLGEDRQETPNTVCMYPGAVPEDTVSIGPRGCCLCLAHLAPAGKNLILAETPYTLRAVFNQIQLWLSKAQALALLAQQVVVNGIGLDEVVARATEIMENPLLVADPSHRIIAISDVELEDSA